VRAARALAMNHRRAAEAQKTLAKKREELARVVERLGAPGLRRGIARSCVSRWLFWRREIAELEQG
jgi:hypothetical protein